MSEFLGRHGLLGLGAASVGAVRQLIMTLNRKTIF
jgi:hypothetical protein